MRKKHIIVRKCFISIEYVNLWFSRYWCLNTLGILFLVRLMDGYVKQRVLIFFNKMNEAFEKLIFEKLIADRDRKSRLGVYA